MRLEPREIQAVRQAACEVFGERAIGRAFGSRVHDHPKGGDLDLYLEVEPGQAVNPNAAWEAAPAFLQLIERIAARAALPGEDDRQPGD